MYHTALKLSLLGWNVMPTARNARCVDLITYNEDATRMLGIQVKSLSKRDPVFLGSNLEKVMGDWWVIVTDIASEARITFIMKPDEVRGAAHTNQNQTTGKLSYWLEPKDYRKAEFQEAWRRIGHGGLDQTDYPHERL